MASLTAPTTRRGAIAAVAGAALALTGLGAGTATGQQRTAHLAPGVSAVTASVRCPLDMGMRIETSQYVASLDVTQDRRPVSTHPLLAGAPRTVMAGLDIRRKGEGVLASESANPDLHLPIQVSFGQYFAHSPSRMGLTRKSEFLPAQVAEIQAIGDSILQQIRALASQVCAPGATDGTINLTADDQRVQPIMASVERLYRRSLPPARVTELK